MVGLAAELFRSAAASPATACARRWRACGSSSRWRCARCPPARGCSTGPCRRSGTSATPGSRTRGAEGRRLPGLQPPPGELQRAGARADAARRAAAAPAQPAGAARPDPLPHLLLPRDWGFCLAHRVLEGLPEGDYEVLIDSTLAPGSLTYGELLLPGASEREFLISCHVCHPSLANDNLSGLAVTLFLARELAPRCRRAALLLPLPLAARHHRRDHLAGAEPRRGARRIEHGLVAANLGDPGPFTTSGAGAATPRSTAPSSTCSPPPASRTTSSLRPLRLRRAPVRLARLRPAGRLAHPHAVGALSRVPHLGRRPRLHHAGGAGRLAGPLSGGGGGDRGR